MIIYKDSVLMSIKPEFAKKIFNGSKKYEFRRIIFKNQRIKKVVVYASSPIKKVIGEFEISKVLEMNLEDLWRETNSHSGISKDLFMDYYRGKDRGFAIKIAKVKVYPEPLCLRGDFNLKPPQSFQYL